MAIEKVILAKPRGFCAGVEMAIESVDRALAQHGAPLY
ncbi:MAG: 4-hydroxy-3-methylbut-2-enyl diphosphate reductase, partial [Candidatus Binatia bacterium]